MVVCSIKQINPPTALFLPSSSVYLPIQYFGALLQAARNGRLKLGAANLHHRVRHLLSSTYLLKQTTKVAHFLSQRSLSNKVSLHCIQVEAHGNFGPFPRCYRSFNRHRSEGDAVIYVPFWIINGAVRSDPTKSHPPMVPSS